MAANECIPYFEAAYTQRITAHMVAGVTGKRFVGPLTTPQSGWASLAADPLAAADGSNIQCAGAPAAAGEVGGVAGWDIGAGGKGPVIRGAGTMLPVFCGAVVTAGNELQVDASGRVIPFSAGRKVGKAHSTTTAADQECIVELYAVGSA